MRDGRENLIGLVAFGDSFSLGTVREDIFESSWLLRLQFLPLLVANILAIVSLHLGLFHDAVVLTFDTRGVIRPSTFLEFCLGIVTLDKLLADDGPFLVFLGTRVAFRGTVHDLGLRCLHCHQILHILASFADHFVESWGFTVGCELPLLG